MGDGGKSVGEGIGGSVGVVEVGGGVERVLEVVVWEGRGEGVVREGVGGWVGGEGLGVGGRGKERV